MAWQVLMHKNLIKVLIDVNKEKHHLFLTLEYIHALGLLQEESFLHTQNLVHVLYQLHRTPKWITIDNAIKFKVRFDLFNDFTWTT